jgi:hypothetical protein
LTFGFYDIFLDETTHNIERRDIIAMSQYPRRMDEVIDAMDLIVVVWRQRKDWYLPTGGFRISRFIAGVR